MSASPVTAAAVAADGRAGGFIGRIQEAGGFARVVLDGEGEPGFDEFGDGIGNERNARFARRSFTRNGDFHDLPNSLV